MENKNHPWVLRSDVVEEPVAPGVIRTVLAYCDNIMAVENRFEEGAIGALHSHPHTQLTYILSGKFKFTIGDESRIVAAGDTLLKRNEVIHGCYCIERGALLDVFTPMRDDFVKNVNS